MSREKAIVSGWGGGGGEIDRYNIITVFQIYLN